MRKITLMINLIMSVYARVNVQAHIDLMSNICVLIENAILDHASLEAWGVIQTSLKV